MCPQPQEGRGSGITSLKGDRWERQAHTHQNPPAHLCLYPLGLSAGTLLFPRNLPGTPALVCSIHYFGLRTSFSGPVTVPHTQPWGFSRASGHWSCGAHRAGWPCPGSMQTGRSSPSPLSELHEDVIQLILRMPPMCPAASSGPGGLVLKGQDQKTAAFSEKEENESGDWCLFPMASMEPPWKGRRCAEGAGAAATPKRTGGMRQHHRQQWKNSEVR